MGCLSRKDIIESVNQSLMNLGLEYIDLLIIHKSDPNCPLEGKVPHLDRQLIIDGHRCKCCLKDILSVKPLPQ